MNSKHSIERAKERAGLNEEQAARFIRKASERGKGAEEMPKKERQYMEQKETASNCRTIYYNNYFFIFSLEGTCITLYEAPVWFGKKSHYDGKEKIRDIKKYMRYSAAQEVA